MGGKLFLLPDGGEPVMTNSSGRGVTGTGSVDALRTLALLALFLASRTALASEPWDAGPFLTPPATLLSVANSKPAPKSAVEILLEQYDYRIEASGAGRPSGIGPCTGSSMRKAAKSWSKVSVSWRPSWDARPTLSARVITSGRRRSTGWTRPRWPKVATRTTATRMARTVHCPRHFRRLLMVSSSRSSPSSKVERLLVSGVFGRRVRLQNWSAKRSVEVRVTMPRALPFSQTVENSTVRPEIRETATERIVTVRAGPFSEVTPEMVEPAMARGSLPLATFSFGTGR